MAPGEMESLVTFPIESAINGASGVRRVRSATAVGIAVVWVEFDWGVDIFTARQLVSEKLALVSGALPPQVERPVLAPISSIMGEILFFAISSDSDDPLALRTIADTVVRRRLRALAGVSHATPAAAAASPPRREPEPPGRDLHRGTAGVHPPGGRPRPIARGDRRKPGGAARIAV